jgi:hypothetical protein
MGRTGELCCLTHIFILPPDLNVNALQHQAQTISGGDHARCRHNAPLEPLSGQTRPITGQRKIGVQEPQHVLARSRLQTDVDWELRTDFCRIWTRRRRQAVCKQYPYVRGNSGTDATDVSGGQGDIVRNRI